MDREALRKHCEQMCKIYDFDPSCDMYMEHKIVLDLLDETEFPKGVTVTDFADRCRECGEEYGKMLEASKPKSGHWISHNEHCEKIGVKPSCLGAYIWCSNCDCGIDIGEFYRIHYNFCPNCGADMRETRESKKNYISEEE